MAPMGILRNRSYFGKLTILMYNGAKWENFGKERDYEAFLIRKIS
jgi:hypothetical protein